MDSAALFPPSDSLDITVDQVSKLLAQADHDGPPFHFVDCREEDEFAHCRLPSARLIPLSTFAESATSVLPDPAQPIVVYCHHGMRSQQAALFLRQKGYRRTFSMRGGIDAWSCEIDSEVPRY